MERLAQLLDLLLGLLEIGRFHEFPLALSPRDRKLMRFRYIHQVHGPARVQRIGAKHDHLLAD
jgi:hypothetical protein